MNLEQLTAEIILLKRRLESVERAAFGTAEGYVEGWPDAAKFVGISVLTARNRHEDGKFPEPCKLEPFERADGQTFNKPTWKESGPRELRGRKIKTRKSACKLTSYAADLLSALRRVF